MKVSAIISTYKGASLLKGCLENLLRQSLYIQGKLEIIIIDSGSPQNEGEITSNFQAKHENIIYERTPQKETLYQAWNRGIKLATGEYITNANTDDRHHPKCLEIMSSALDSDQSISLVYGQLQRVYTSRELESEKFECDCSSQEYFPGSLFIHYFYGAQPMWKASVHESVGFFSEKYKIAGDYEFAFRLMSKGFHSRYLPTAKGKMLWHEDALSMIESGGMAEKEKLQIWSTYRNDETILQAYKSFVIKRGTKIDKDFSNECMLDLGLRALCFFPQFDNEKPSFDLSLAKFAFSRNFNDRRFINNSALLDLLTGNKVSHRFEDVVRETKCKVMIHNLAIIKNGFQEKPFWLFKPSFPLPSESELKKIQSPYSRKESISEIGSNSTHLDCFDYLQFKETYFQSINFQSITNSSELYLWGLNEKALILANCLNYKELLKIHFLDSFFKENRFSNQEVLNPESILNKKCNANCIFILCMNRSHWKKLEDRIKISQPKSTIFFL